LVSNFGETSAISHSVSEAFHCTTDEWLRTCSIITVNSPENNDEALLEPIEPLQIKRGPRGPEPELPLLGHLIRKGASTYPLGDVHAAGRPNGSLLPAFSEALSYSGKQTTPARSPHRTLP
jgi:hypothetical protein